MKPKLYQRVALNRDYPDEGLKRGDVGWLIDYLSPSADGEEGCILEIFNAVGESIDIATVPVSAIEELRADQIPSVRTLKQSG